MFIALAMDDPLFRIYTIGAVFGNKIKKNKNDYNDYNNNNNNIHKNTRKKYSKVVVGSRQSAARSRHRTGGRSSISNIGNINNTRTTKQSIQSIGKNQTKKLSIKDNNNNKRLRTKLSRMKKSRKGGKIKKH